MDITSLNSAREPLDSQPEGLISSGTVTTINRDESTHGSNQGKLSPEAEADAAYMALHLQNQPLALTRKVLVDKINEVFEVHDPASGLAVTSEALTAEQTAADVVRALALAYRTFKTRFGDVADSDIMHRFQALATQTLSEGLLEARAAMARLDLYEARTADQLNHIDERINAGLAGLGGR